MGGVVSDIGELGQGVIDTVSDVGVSIDQGVRDTLGPNGWTLAALMAAGYYYAPEIGAYVNASGSTVPASAVVDAGVVSSPVTTGSVIATELPAFGTTAASSAAGTALANAATPAAVTPAVTAPVAEALTPLSPVVPALNSTTALSTVAPVTAEGAAAGGLGSTQTSLLGGAFDWATASPQNALTAASLGLTAAKALGGGGTTSTSSSSVDPDVKAAYLRNLEEARATAAGLGPKQFAAFPEYNLGMVQKYMNPYEQEVIQGTLGDIERARQGQISAEGAAATAAKAFGGSRQGVTRSLVDEAALRNATNAVAQLRQGGFTQAQNLGLSQEALRQQYEQSKLDAARNLGLERLGVSQGALSLQPSAGTQSAPLYTNQATSALGGALGGAKLGSLIGGTTNPEYAAYGAGIGGLLGFM
ncbi:hypothetical protein UFOVP515_8 [uncultured Caudovirales phage]|uniref:Uncharacterized protein n=1 Tax=uncultured Caudovirales phage TaxID=2100421 RepID=A0A6J5MIR6_9CAUD|nr:hypothetical protein UFOVP515_8 [uncultured Caudovirales phage]